MRRIRLRISPFIFLVSLAAGCGGGDVNFKVTRSDTSLAFSLRACGTSGPCDTGFTPVLDGSSTYTSFTVALVVDDKISPVRVQLFESGATSLCRTVDVDFKPAPVQMDVMLGNTLDYACTPAAGCADQGICVP